jgi:hypothetical protein
MFKFIKEYRTKKKLIENLEKRQKYELDKRIKLENELQQGPIKLEKKLKELKDVVANIKMRKIIDE